MDADRTPSGPRDGDLPRHVAENRRSWNADAENWVARGEASWASEEPFWGNWSRPNTEVPMLPERLDGLDCIELGCGTAYGSGWMHRRGARRVVGVDISEGQLHTAQRLAAEHHAPIELLHASAEAVPLPDNSFDMALSEYGASIWCDPHAWLPEAHRLLRPGGRLVFLGTHPLAQVCAPVDGSLPVTERLERPWFGMHELDWTDATDEPGGVEFCLPTSAWFQLFREVGFIIEDYAEPRSHGDDDAPSSAITSAWADRWPSEQVWWLRRET